MKSFLHPRAGTSSTLSARGIQLLGLLAAGLVWAAVGRSATFTESFSSNPLTHGWQIYGNTNLFSWDSVNQNLDVTWDSSQTNSYFYRPLGTILAKPDAFSVAFDLQITNIADNSPQIAIGLLNFASATNITFSRPAATTPNLFEFDYYANNGNGQPSIDATLTDTNVGPGKTQDFYFVYDNLPLNTGLTYHIVMTHVAGSTAISGQVSTGGNIYTSLPSVYLGSITDFRIDTVSVSSYGGGPAATPAQGIVDNFVITLPPPPVQNLAGSFSNTVWSAKFTGQTNWLYTLQRSTNFAAWINVVAGSISSGTNVSLADSNAPTGQAFYRVQATRP